MNRTILLVFAFVYLGMILGRIPRLQLDRTGIALLGTLVLLATGAVGLEEAKAAVDTPTLGLLFAFMVLSAQLRLGGFYTRVVRAVTAFDLTPDRLLAAIVVVTGLLSAVFTNDVVCLAVAPLVVEACVQRRLAPVPFLLAVACASNVGSAATLIGNPQNILIGQGLGLSFSRYLLEAGVPALLGLVVIWAVVATRYRGRFDAGAIGVASGAAGGGEPRQPAEETAAPAWDGWQATKGLAVTAVLLVAFLATDWPREIVALAGAASCSAAASCTHARCSDWSTGRFWSCLPASSSSTMRSIPPARWSRESPRSTRAASTRAASTRATRRGSSAWW